MVVVEEERDDGEQEVLRPPAEGHLSVAEISPAVVSPAASGGPLLSRETKVKLFCVSPFADLLSSSEAFSSTHQ